MPLSHNEISPLFGEQGLPPVAVSPAPAVKSPRSQRRAAGWRSDMARSASYLMGQARSDEERVQIEELYDQAVEAGPDFLRYRGKSAFQDAPKLGIDRNAYARILHALDLIERGTYRHGRAKGKQGIPRTAARVLKALLGVALKYGKVYPSLVGIAHLARVCKQTVVNCLKLLEQYGFVVIQRRIRRERTAIGVKVVQDTNAYVIQEPTGLGALAVSVFGQRSESKICAPLSHQSYSSLKTPPLERENPVALALAGLQKAMRGTQRQTA